MDRRQKKTRKAIFEAFARLLAKESYTQITVQEIIDEADVGRTTFYAHFETKDHLLIALCEELFGHIIESAKDRVSDHGQSTEYSIFCHLLMHIKEDSKIVTLLSHDSSELFLHYFRDSLSELVREQCLKGSIKDLPDDFVVDFISGSFVEIVLWWLKGGMSYTPEEVDRYFTIAIGSLLPPKENH